MKAVRTMVALLVVAVGALTFAGQAAAKDRNNDNIPDRWEKRHDLSLKVKQGKRDQDKDGLNNRAEFKAKTDPRDADSDDDGLEDGEEGAGVVDSYDPETGVLVVNLFGADPVEGLVTEATEISCGCKGTRPEDETDEGDESEEPEELFRGGPRPGGEAPEGDEGERPSRGERGDGPRPPKACDDGALRPGAPISELEYEDTGDGIVFTEIELVKKHGKRGKGKGHHKPPADESPDEGEETPEV